MYKGTYDEWKNDLINYLKTEISNRLIDHYVTDLISIETRPGSIFRDQGIEVQEFPNGRVLFSANLDLTETVEPFILSLQINFPFWLWYEDQSQYKHLLKSTIENTSTRINQYTVRQLCNEGQQFSVESDKITNNDIFEVLNKLNHYPDSILLHPVIFWDFLTNNHIRKDKKDTYFLRELKAYSTRELSNSEALVFKKEDILMQKNNLSVQLFPDKNPTELYINEKRIIWAYTDRGIGHIFISHNSSE